MDLTVYENKLKPRFFSKPKSLLETNSSFGIRRWMKQHFKNIPQKRHRELHEEANAKAEAIDKHWWAIVNAEFKRIHNRPLTIFDYKKSGIVRDEFSEEIKVKLTELGKQLSDYRHIAFAHHLMLPKG